MSSKRAREDTDAVPSTSYSHPLTHRKRRKSSPATSWLPTKSDAEAFLVASGKRSSTTQDDELMSEGKDSESDEESSVVSTSSEEPSSESSPSEASSDDAEDEQDDADEPSDPNQITSLPRPPKASTRRRLYAKEDKASERIPLSERLKAFLPELAAANAELEKEKAAGRLKDLSLEVEDGNEGEQQYIEMDLGLGVLEEKDPNAAESSSESSDEADDETEMDGEGGSRKKSREKDVLGKLMGRERTKSKVGIQEIPDQ